MKASQLAAIKRYRAKKPEAVKRANRNHKAKKKIERLNKLRAKIGMGKL